MHSGLIALATLLYGVPLLVAAGASGSRSLPIPIPDAGERVVQARFDPIPVPIDRPEAPTPPAPAAPKVAPTPILPTSTAGTSASPVPAPPEPAPAIDADPDEVEADSTPSRGAPRHPRAGKRVCDEPFPQIRVRDDGVVEIDRTLVEQYTDNLEAFMRLGVSRPYDEGGVKGWFISGFGCASPVYKAGFRRSDVLLSVNGKPTRSWVGVFMLYQKLKNRDEFEIALLRRGEPVTLRFRVVPS